jgi:hypothetical protein
MTGKNGDGKKNLLAIGSLIRWAWLWEEIVTATVTSSRRGIRD